MRSTARIACVLAPLIAGAGMVCDLAGEGVYTLLLAGHTAPEGAAVAAAAQIERFTALQRLGTLLCAGAANGLYTAAGVLLTLATPALPGGIRGAMWLTWAAGAALSAGAIAASTTLMATATAILFPAFILWTVWMAWRWRVP